MERSEIEKMIKEEVLNAVSRMKDTLLLQLIGFMEQEKYEEEHQIPKSRPERLKENEGLGIDIPEEDSEVEEEDSELNAPSLKRVDSAAD